MVKIDYKKNEIKEYQATGSIYLINDSGDKIILGSNSLIGYNMNSWIKPKLIGLDKAIKNIYNFEKDNDMVNLELMEMYHFPDFLDSKIYQKAFKIYKILKRNNVKINRIEEGQ